MKTIDDLRAINSGAIDQMEKLVDETDTLMDDSTISLADESRLISRRATLQAQTNNQKLIQVHLKAAAVIVDFSATDEKELDDLADKMDGFIIHSLKMNAVLGLFQKVIDTAIAIGNSVNAHTGRAA